MMCSGVARRVASNSTSKSHINGADWRAPLSALVWHLCSSMYWTTQFQYHTLEEPNSCAANMTWSRKQSPSYTYSTQQPTFFKYLINVQLCILRACNNFLRVSTKTTSTSRSSLHHEMRCMCAWVEALLGLAVVSLQDAP